ncbi:MAG: PAS domain-containing protein [bacterium]|nr:PAS domain-containing protein [bacterium]
MKDSGARPSDLPAGWPARWQDSLDAIAGVGDIPTVLVCRREDRHIAIVVSNSSSTAPLSEGDLLPMEDVHYLDPVFSCADVWHVADTHPGSLSGINGPVSLIGFPLHRPDGSVFGALCALDGKPNEFSGNARALMARVRRAMETELVAHEENLCLQREIAAHEATTRALRASEALHEEAQRIARLGHWFHDLVSGELIWSDELFRIYEIDKTRFPASYAAFLDLVHPDDRLALDAAFSHSIMERKDFLFDYRLLMKDGRIKWMNAQAVTHYDASGIPLSSAGTTQDITIRKEVECALRESEALHRTAQSLAQIGHWQRDLLTNELAWSDELFRIFEIDPQRFPASYETFLQLVHPDERDALDAAYAGSIAGRTDYHFEHRLVMPDGRIKWVIECAVTRYADDGTPLLSIGTTQDITVSKEATRERDILAEVVRHSREFVNVADLDGRMVFLNEAGGRMTGIEPAHATRHLITEVVPPHLLPLVEQELLPTLKGDGYWEGDLQYRHLDTGELRDVRATCFLILDRKTGAPAYLANVSIDMTERKAAEQEKAALQHQLLHVQKLESLGIMAGGIAHDFNNILQVIIGSLDLVSPARADDRHSHDALACARQAAVRAVDITRQLLTFAGRDLQPRQPVDLGQIIEESASLMRTVIDKRVHLHIIPPPGALTVDAVPGQLQQVLMNLVSNAAEAISDGKGAITVSCGCLLAGSTVPYRLTSLMATRTSTADVAWLEVQDNGQGMDRDTLARLFDPFFTSKAHGRGLGMASVLGIVRAHDGAHEVVSEPGHGTTVRILLPMTATRLEVIQVQQTGRQESWRVGRVLLVDDDASIRMVCQELLRRRGFSVTCAAGGAEAIALLSDGAPSFDCVILDLTMPGIDGGEVFRFLRERHPALPVLLASGYDHAEVMRRIPASGNTAFISKPWSIESLFNAIALLLPLQDQGEAATPAS